MLVTKMRNTIQCTIEQTGRLVVFSVQKTLCSLCKSQFKKCITDTKYNIIFEYLKRVK